MSSLSSCQCIAAFACTFLISLLPNLLLVVFPNFDSTSKWLSVGQAMAAGGLLGDVFLHTLGHAASGSEIGYPILFGFGIFFTVDMILTTFGGASGDVHHHHHHQLSTSTTTKTNDSKTTSSTTKKFSSTVLLNLGADSLHNFTDGMAIGATFASTSTTTSGDLGNLACILSLLRTRGGLVALSVLFHEVPHEMGDYCILLHEGFSKRQAILAQFGTALAAMLGTGFGLIGTTTLFVAEEELLIGIVSGGFIYLSTVQILPIVLQDVEKQASIMFQVWILMAFGIGIGFMHVVSLLEEEHDGHSHGHSHHHHHNEHRTMDHHDHHGHNGHHHHHHHHGEL